MKTTSTFPRFPRLPWPHCHCPFSREHIGLWGAEGIFWWHPPADARLRKVVLNIGGGPGFTTEHPEEVMARHLAEAYMPEGVPELRLLELPPRYTVTMKWNW